MTETMSEPFSPPRRPASRAWRVLGGMIFLAALVAAPLVLTDGALFGVALPRAPRFDIDLRPINLTLVFMLGALSLNLLTGTAGVISLGHAALFAIGAMAAAAAGGRLGWPFLAALAAATLTGALAGLIVGLPALRVRGLHLLLSTLALHHVVIYAMPWLKRLVFGAADLAYAPPTLGPLAIDTPLRWYWLLLAIVTALFWALVNIRHGRPGLAMMAMRDHEAAASALGADVRVLTLQAFAMSSGVAGLAGALYVYLAPGATPGSFGIDFAVAFIAMIVVGGLDSPWGALLGAGLWRLAPALVSGAAARIGDATPRGAWIGAHQPQIVTALFGVAAILLLLVAPRGLAGLGRWRSLGREP